MFSLFACFSGVWDVPSPGEKSSFSGLDFSSSDFDVSGSGFNRSIYMVFHFVHCGF